MSQTTNYYPVHIPLGLALIVLQSTLLAKTGHQNILIVLILHLSSTGRFLTGGLLTLFFGLVQDTFSGAPAGWSSLFYLPIFFTGSLFSRGLSLGHPFFLMGVVFIAGALLMLIQTWLVCSSLPTVIQWISVVFTSLVSPFLVFFFSFMESLYDRISRPKTVD